MSVDNNYQLATFAGGCFWCLESAFRAMEGVVRVTSGYTGGTIPYPTYEQVCGGTTGHVEAVEVEYDPAVVKYSALLERYWLNIDPTDQGGQFVDRGSQYRTVIFTNSVEQQKEAEMSRKTIALDARFKKPIATEIKNVGVFYPAEEYHQEYDKKFPGRYKLYVWGSGRANGLKQLWEKGQVNPVMDLAKIEEDLIAELEAQKSQLESKPEIIDIKTPNVSEESSENEAKNEKIPVLDVEKVIQSKSEVETPVVRFGTRKEVEEVSNIKLPKEAEVKLPKKEVDLSTIEMDKKEKEEKLKSLSQIQIQVTQECGTEPPFANKYWNEEREGIYVDLISGEVLFSSKDKFDSGTGWPSFTAPIKKEILIEKEDNSGFVKRVEVKSSLAGSHLGHVFEDGPKEKGGRRYCVNSAALRFIPKEELVKEGYGEWEDKC